MNVYDCLVVGGGPAGLSSAIYMARFNRSVLILDKGEGRWNTHELNENYLGFPEGIKVRHLRDLGQQQAKRFRAEIVEDEISAINKVENIFLCTGNEAIYRGKTLIIATGVVDLFPEFPDVYSYIGRSLFWCITCDGYKTRGRKVVVIGRNDDAAITAQQFLTYTSDITLLLNCHEQEHRITKQVKNNLAKANIRVVGGNIRNFEGENGMIRDILLEKETLEAEYVFNQQGCVPCSKIMKDIEIETSEDGYIIVDTEQRTNIPFIYAAGDVTKPHAHQIVTAAHEGSMAAQSANYDLYTPAQRGEI